jgi:4-hydroxybenzoyl-CoA thioesterase
MTPIAFEAPHRVRFADCDPAGIVFFPRYLELLHDAFECWFDEGMGIAYSALIGERRTGFPTVRLEVDFSAISRHGDALVRRIRIQRLGRTSLALAHEFVGTGAAGGPELRLAAKQVVVCTSLATHRPQPFPDDVRRHLDAAAPREPG